MSRPAWPVFLAPTALVLALSCTDDAPLTPDLTAASGGQLMNHPAQGTGGGPSHGSGGSPADPDNAGGLSAAMSGGMTGAGGAPALGSGGQGAGGAGGSPDWPTANCPQPKDLGVRIVGRHDGCDQEGVRMAWSGTGFVARFSGTGLRFSQAGSAVQYTVLVDGEVQANLTTNQGSSTYDVVSGLATGEHVVEVYRRGEASFGATTLTTVEAVGGELLAPPTRPSRRLEFYGDSITCGYGNEGTSTSCTFSADTENHYLTYAALLGRKFSAETATIAWSGKGVVVNYNGDVSTTLPQMAERALPELTESVWDYSLLPPPQAVIINLGTNDFSTDHDPSAEDFKNGYLELVGRIRAWYPAAFIVGTVGPMLSGTDLASARAGIAAAMTALTTAGDQNVLAYELQIDNPEPGCDWHPNLDTHQAMADELGAVLEQHLGW